MPLSKSRDYLSIGEVLELLKPDFPDISVSKLRFLEGEELVSPERTPSGYRKFFDEDVRRLRYILSLQRDHFLPLKVIRERLDAIDAGEATYETPPEQHTSRNTPTQTSGNDLEVDLTGVQLSRPELLKAAGLTELQLTGLEDFDLVRPDGSGFYDENDLVAAEAASGFLGHGVEPRHLRMYRQFADREAAFYEQIVSPMAHRRDAESKAKAYVSLQDLMDLSRKMREAVLRSSVRTRQP